MKKPLDTYLVSFGGLRSGTHHYDYLIEHPFFAKFEYSPIKEGRVWVNLDVTKQDTMLLFDFGIKGTVNVPCNRCTENFDFSIQGDNRLIVKIGDESFEESDEVVALPKWSFEINVAEYIYEFINLLIPFKVVHPLDKKGNSLCNKETLAVLQKLQQEKLPAHKNDPRWDALKKVKL